MEDGTLYPEIYADESKLYYGNFDPFSSEYNSLSHWFIDESGRNIYIRLPWMMLNVSDPSSHMVLYDERPVIPKRDGRIERDQIGCQRTEGMMFYLALTKGDNLLDYQPRVGNSFNGGISPYLWTGWDAPSYRTRLKQGYQQVAESYYTLK